MIIFLLLSKIGIFLFKIQLHNMFFLMIKVKEKFHIIILVMIVVTALLKVVVEMLGLMLEIIKL